MVAVERQALQGKALVESLRQGAQPVSGDVQGLQVLQIPDLCKGRKV